MNKSITSLYLYDDVKRLTMWADPTTYDNTMDNATMYKKPIKVHKGLNNTVTFRVFSPDKKPMNVRDRELYVRIMDKETGELLIEKLTEHGEKCGFIKFTINEKDTRDMGVGLYSLTVVQGKNSIFSHGDTEIYSPIFTDYSSNVNMELEVTNQAEYGPVDSYHVKVDEMSERRQYNDTDGRYESHFYSSAIPAPRTKSASNGLISFCTKTDGFSGELYVYATLEQSPNPDIDRGWAKIDLDEEITSLTYVDHTGNRHFTFRGEYMWIKFVVVPRQDNEFSDEIKNFKDITVRI